MRYDDLTRYLDESAGWTKPPLPTVESKTPIMTEGFKLSECCQSEGQETTYAKPARRRILTSMLEDIPKPPVRTGHLARPYDTLTG